MFGCVCLPIYLSICLVISFRVIEELGIHRCRQVHEMIEQANARVSDAISGCHIRGGDHWNNRLYCLPFGLSGYHSYRATFMTYRSPVYFFSIPYYHYSSQVSFDLIFIFRIRFLKIWGDRWQFTRQPRLFGRFRMAWAWHWVVISGYYRRNTCS